MKLRALFILVFMVVLTVASAGVQSRGTVCSAAAPCDCIANACCVAWCPTCCGKIACRDLTDEEVKAFEGKHK